ncbi:FAD-binding protein [Truepera radiovictrix]|uniref:FAD linked oxidase domain protein n=1 Tax=Truepera radiovictrix (strain DSM 17093 / CIP 108686 / LMG 22925 / RQ-24) TaxID=649638 RepID=D7CY49_TRURR|nr:FAD-binding protein [Truepera radiovictrix]ADI14688.1 FAD linked oxidase domain protein [Truepera radiovictrix DSM 17093]WMT56762.1 FAD-binding protein [Truepera radiovictrix]
MTQPTQHEVVSAHLREHAQALREAVLGRPTVRVVGGGTKGALSGDGTLSTGSLSGVLEYDPQEYTLSALAGTPLREIAAQLAERGQYLPFDPPFAAAGATVGGTVAAGLSGPGRFRYGGVRDFILGVTFVSGSGELLTGGGKVVKNAAGFDLPKLMVGSLGQFGVLVAATFKVFPQPERYATLALETAHLDEGVALMERLARSSFEPHALELEPAPSGGARLWVRLGGRAEALPARVARLQAFTRTGDVQPRQSEVLTDEAEAAFWEEARAFAWVPAEHALVKVALSPAELAGLEGALVGLEEAVGAPLRRRYGVGGNVLYVGWPASAPPAALAGALQRLKLPGLALTGRWPTPLLGHHPGGALFERVRSVFDPQGRFRLTAPRESHAA